MKFIYCRGGDKDAPKIAQAAGMEYGIRYDYPAYSNVYMLDAGLAPKWTTYKRKVAKHKPTFALVPDFEEYRDAIQIQLYIDDLRAMGVPLIGVTPKFYGALAQIELAQDIVICESVPSTYSGYLIKDDEIKKANYHLLGGDVRAHVSEIKRIRNLGGNVISADGNKLMLKAVNGQIWNGEKWQVVKQTTYENALISAKNIMLTLGLNAQ